MARRLFAYLCAGMLCALATLAGCTTAGRSSRTDAPADSSEAAVSSRRHPVYVYVDGRERGLVPATIRLRRGMGDSEVTLVQEGRTIRAFLLERATSANATALTYSFFGENDPEGTRYDASLLPRAGAQYVIPYFHRPVLIEDRQYALTLIVEN